MGPGQPGYPIATPLMGFIFGHLSNHRRARRVLLLGTLALASAATIVSTAQEVDKKQEKKIMTGDLLEQRGKELRAEIDAHY
jgi:hypothetical protein